MKRLAAAVLIAASLGLGGCASTGSGNWSAITLATKSVVNPISVSEEAQIELGFDIAVRALLTYRRECIAGRADVNCRANIALVQPYTRQARPLIDQLRNFVDKNDQVNAVVVYNQLSQLFTNLKAAASAVGINVEKVS